ncbi:MAG: hypothetical protein GQF41_2182 [Candidatus Rifleibacterium amylolyticum]|nr:MAG: hypothetical protein GQF41_2182 [Candidatus Rifleibacterium amylolyticum]
MKKLLCLMLLLNLFLITGNTPLSADARSDYENYVSTYQAYRNAVNEKKPASEILELLETYQNAKAAYENSYNRQKTQTAVEPADVQTQPTSSGSTATRVTAAVNAADTEYSAATRAKLPTGLQRILDQLWSEPGRKSPD